MEHLKEDERIKEQFRLRQQPISDEARRRVADTLAGLPHRPATRRRKLRAGLTAACLALVLAGVGGLAAMKSDSAWARSVQPMMNSIFNWFGDRGLSSDNVPGSDMAVLAEKTDKGYILRIHEMKFDGLRLSFSYSLAMEDGSGLPKNTFVSPEFQLDASVKRMDPAVSKSDSGVAYQGNRLGIVNYFFSAELPEQFELKVNVPKLAFMEAGWSSQSTIGGDWSLVIPVYKAAGETVRNLYGGESYAKQDSGLKFGFVSGRFSDIGSVWHLELEQPYERVVAKLESKIVRYGIKYELRTDNGRTIGLITSRTNGRIQDRSQPTERWIYKEKVLLYAEPLPDGADFVTVVPILMKFPLNKNKEEYTEEELTSLAIEIPVS